MSTVVADFFGPQTLGQPSDCGGMTYTQVVKTVSCEGFESSTVFLLTEATEIE